MIEPIDGGLEIELATRHLELLDEIGGAGEEHAPSVLDQARPMAAARWLFPPPGEAATYCRVSWRRADSLSVSPAMWGDGSCCSASAAKAGTCSSFISSMGSLAHIPCWMMSEAAAHHHLRSEQRLPLEHLRDLRIEVDSLLDFLRLI